MLKIGLTGGIGCGKTTVSKLFEKLEIVVIDADDISRNLTKPHQIGLQQIENAFGATFILKNGELNRTALKKHIFENSAAKTQLEAILHPLIFQEIAIQIAKFNAPYCIISIPLLFETNSQNLVDRILVIDCNAQIQIERVQKRDNLPLEQVQKIINSQVSAEFRKNNAHDLLNNTKNQALLAKEVKKLHNFYLSLSLNYAPKTCDLTHYLRIPT
jgi:dephospho-CoA kinase